MISRGCIPLNLVRREKKVDLHLLELRRLLCHSRITEATALKHLECLNPGLTFTRTQCEDKDLQLPIKKLLENYFIILVRLSETT